MHNYSGIKRKKIKHVQKSNTFPSLLNVRDRSHIVCRVAVDNFVLAFYFVNIISLITDKLFNALEFFEMAMLPSGHLEETEQRGCPAVRNLFSIYKLFPLRTRVLVLTIAFSGSEEYQLIKSTVKRRKMKLSN